jgi:hypothetical protein
MSHPFIIWCRQRTGSISLFYSLCSVSEHSPAEIEPFDFGNVGDRQFSYVGKRLTPSDRDRELRAICDGRILIKHCYENLSAEFNHALAEISTRAGYRHVHLRRKDEVARLISKGVAEQHGTWGAHPWTRALYDEWRAKRLQLPPLDIPRLREYHERSESRWNALAGLLRPHEVTFEELFSAPATVLPRLAAYIGVPDTLVPVMRKNLGTGQRTWTIWDLIPNVEELRIAITR